MDAIEIAKIDLVIANRVLAEAERWRLTAMSALETPKIQAVSFFRDRWSPELVTRDDLMEFSFDGQAINGDLRPRYREVVIHSAVYAARSDVNAVVHGHPKQVLPFTVSQIPLRPVYFGANECGADIPVWDIRDKFGDTDVLVVTEAQGREMARALGDRRVLLLRGHGMVAVGRSAVQLVRISRSLLTNAEMYLDALRLGPVKEMSAGELEARNRTVSSDDNSPSIQRGWEYEALKAGCSDLLEERRDRLKRLSTRPAAT